MIEPHIRYAQHVEICQKAKDEKDRKEELVRLAEQRRLDKIRAIEEAKQYKIRQAEEERQAKIRQNNQQYNNTNQSYRQESSSYESHICAYCRNSFTGKGYYLSYTSSGLQMNRSSDDGQELCCSSAHAYAIMRN